MELVKKNIHFNRITKEAGNQITIEEDVNIPDTKDDIEAVLYHNQKVLIEEVKPSENKVHIRGKILYAILYRSEETGRLCSTEGSIPIDEQLYIEGVSSSDKVMVKPQLEDFSVSIINSRKISIQAILELKACVQELYDEEITTAINDMECEMQTKECDFTQLAVCKKDIFRFRETVNLPGNMPNVESIIFSNLKVQEVMCKPMDGQLLVQGKVNVFVIYDGERDSYDQMYQTTVPFSTMIECTGCKPNMISQVSYEVLESQLHLDEDFDGEDRSFLIELVLELDIKLYEPQKVGVLWDLYGLQKEMTPKVETIGYDVLHSQQKGTIKVSDKTTLTDAENSQVKLLYTDGKCVLENCEVTGFGLKLSGMLICQVFYQTMGEEPGYGSMQCVVPFHETLEVVSENRKESMSCSANINCDDLQFVVDMEGGLEVKGNVCYDILLFEKTTGHNISGVDVKEMDVEKYNNLPSMAVYFTKPGDTLWEMGKKYCVPIKQIAEMNHLSSEEVPSGERVLIVRGMQG